MVFHPKTVSDGKGISINVVLKLLNPKDHQIEQTETALSTARDQLTALNLTVDVKIRHGDPFAETLKCAADRDISAIATNSTDNSI